MKRTPLKRHTPLSPVNSKRRKARKATQFAAQAKLCRALPCAACGRPGPSDPAHVVSRGAGGGDRGNVIPLCKSDPRTGHEGCHQAQHQRGWGALYAMPLVVVARIPVAEAWRSLSVQAWALGHAQGLAVAAYPSAKLVGGTG